MTKLEWLQRGNRHAKVITRKLRQDLVSDPSLGIVGPFARYSRACSQYNILSRKQNQLDAQIFLICLLLFSTCFGQLCAHHQEKMPYLFDT